MCWPCFRRRNRESSRAFRGDERYGGRPRTEYRELLLDVTGSWHWLFLINLPIAAALVVCGGLFIAETKEPEAKRLDLAGTMLLSLAILSCMIGITNLNGAKLSESIMDVKVYGYLLGAASLSGAA